MKIKSLLLVGALVFSLFAEAADNSSLFNYDHIAASSKMEKITAVEKFVNQNEGITISSLNEDGKLLVSNASLDESYLTNKMSSDGPAGIPSFLWGFAGGCVGGILLVGGCVLGLAGVLFVYIETDNDKDETLKAFYGCLAANLLWVGVWVFYFAYGYTYLFF